MAAKKKKPKQKPRTLEQQEDAIRRWADKYDAIYTGYHENKHRKNFFRLSKVGREDRLVFLSGLERGAVPFRLRTPSEQVKDVIKYAAKHGANYTGEYKDGSSEKLYRLSKPGCDDRWIALSGLDYGDNPFRMPTIPEQETEAMEHAFRMGATYEGYERRGPDNFFKLSKPGRAPRWFTISVLRRSGKKRDPFNRLNPDEQDTEIRKQASRLGAVYTGVVRKNIRGGSTNTFELSKPGFENIFIRLGQAKRAVDPFGGMGGFDVSKPGWVYLLLVTLSNGKPYIKLGITNYIDARFSNHTAALRRAGATCELLDKKKSKDGAKVLDRETYLKQLFKPHRVGLRFPDGSELDGFTHRGGECFHIDVKDQIVAELKRLVKSPKMLK